MDLVKEKCVPKEYISVDVLSAQQLLNQGYRYLDVRAEEDFKKGHLENALNIAYLLNTSEGRVKNPEFLDQVLAFCNKEDNLIVGCGTGGRSVHATIDLLDAEFKNVRNMGGGYKAWVGNDFQVTKPNPSGF